MLFFAFVFLAVLERIGAASSTQSNPMVAMISGSVDVSSVRDDFAR